MLFQLKCTQLTRYALGKPDALTNCTLSNQTSDSLYIECVEGFDGGLKQSFVVEVYESQHRKLVSNVTTKIPTFVVNGLESGVGFDIALYAANSKGRSPLTRLSAFTLKGAEKHTGNSLYWSKSKSVIAPALTVISGVLTTLSTVGTG